MAPYEENPVYYDRLSKRLEAILEELKGQWAEQVQRLRPFIWELQRGRQTDFTGLDPKAQLPFLDILEVEVDRGLASEKSDQYALGCIAYELCTGRLPYKEAPFSTTQGRPKPPLAPRLLNHKLAVHAERAILRALSISPDQHYNDVSAFVTALGAS